MVIGISLERTNVCPTFCAAAEQLYPEADHPRMLAHRDDPDPPGDHPRPQQDLHLAVGVSVGGRLLHHGHPVAVSDHLDSDQLRKLDPLAPRVPALGDHPRDHHLRGQLHLQPLVVTGPGDEVGGTPGPAPALRPQPPVLGAHRGGAEAAAGGHLGVLHGAAADPQR